MREYYPRTRESKHERLIVFLIAVGIALAVALGYDLIMWVAERWNAQPFG